MIDQYIKPRKKIHRNFKIDPFLNEKLKMVAQKMGVTQTAIVEAGLRKLFNDLDELPKF